MSDQWAKEQRRQLESIRRGFTQIEAGHHIPHQAMKKWLLSLGSRDELPVPRCVCGKSHDESRQRSEEAWQQRQR